MLPVLIVLVGAPTVLGHYLSDLTLPATVNDQHQQSAEAEDVTAAEKCLSSGKILYENGCHQLLTEGPCGYGQWLVLDDRWDGRAGWTPTAKCARRRCSESDVYWPRDGFCYDADTARRRRLCPGAGTVLATDEFGDGRCACLDNGRDGEVPHVRLSSGRRRGEDQEEDREEDHQDEDRDDDDEEEDTRPCYAAYTRGPCRRGHVITPSAPGYGNCTADRCADHERFSVAPDAARPACVATAALQLDLFSDKRTTTEATAAAGPASPSLEQQPACKTDHRGECVEGVDLAPVADPAVAFRERLLESARRHAQRAKEKKKKRAPSAGRH